MRFLCWIEEEMAGKYFQKALLNTIWIVWVSSIWLIVGFKRRVSSFLSSSDEYIYANWKVSVLFRLSRALDNSRQTMISSNEDHKSPQHVSLYQNKITPRRSISINTCYFNSPIKMISIYALTYANSHSFVL